MKHVIALLLVFGFGSGMAQTVKLVEGDLKPLKGESSIALKFKYDNMTIGDDGQSEAEYIKKKKGDLNAKEAGRGDKWEQAWFDDRESRFEPKFRELFTKHSKLQVNDNAKYTLVFNTTRTEPGWLATGIIRKNARIDGEVLIVESADPSKVIAKLQVVNAPGQAATGLDWDTGLRIQEAYAKSGKEVGRLIAK